MKPFLWPPTTLLVSPKTRSQGLPQPCPQQYYNYVNPGRILTWTAATGVTTTKSSAIVNVFGLMSRVATRCRVLRVELDTDTERGAGATSPAPGNPKRDERETDAFIENAFGRLEVTLSRNSVLRGSGNNRRSISITLITHQVISLHFFVLT